MSQLRKNTKTDILNRVRKLQRKDTKFLNLKSLKTAPSWKTEVIMVDDLNEDREVPPLAALTQTKAPPPEVPGNTNEIIMTKLDLILARLDRQEEQQKKILHQMDVLKKSVLGVSIPDTHFDQDPDSDLELDPHQPPEQVYTYIQFPIKDMETFDEVERRLKADRNSAADIFFPIATPTEANIGRELLGVLCDEVLINFYKRGGNKAKKLRDSVFFEELKDKWCAGGAISRNTFDNMMVEQSQKARNRYRHRKSAVEAQCEECEISPCTE